LKLSIILPSHNPDRARLQRTLAGLRAQTLRQDSWELLVVDNASRPPVGGIEGGNARLVVESQLGLTHARRRGFSESRAEFIVMVDDDNVLAPDYLERALALFAAHPRIGALGGRSVPEFETEPPAWAREFDDLLACRDLGPEPLISSGLRPPGAARNEYPRCAPIGAGMALRRAAVQCWLDASGSDAPPDRQGGDLSSGGDNDIVLSLMRAGWEVGYFPELSLTHLIPAARIAVDYLARLNFGIQKSWMQVLARHDANPWPPLTPAGAAVRKARAWLTHRAWSSPAARIRWRGACGHFEGRTLINAIPAP